MSNIDKLRVSELKDIIREYKSDNCPALTKMKRFDLLDFIKKMKIDEYGKFKNKKNVIFKEPAEKPPAKKKSAEPKKQPEKKKSAEPEKPAKQKKKSAKQEKTAKPEKTAEPIEKIKIKLPKNIRKASNILFSEEPISKAIVPINKPVEKIEKIQVRPKSTTKKTSKKTSKKNIGCPSKNINEDDLDCNDKRKANLLLHPDRNPSCVSDAKNKFTNYNNRCDSGSNFEKNEDINPENIPEKDKTKEMKNFEKNYKILVEKYDFLRKPNLNQKMKDLGFTPTKLYNKFLNDYRKFIKIYEKLDKNKQDLYITYYSDVYKLVDIVFTIYANSLKTK